MMEIPSAQNGTGSGGSLGSQTRERAATLVAQDELTDQEIAEAVGIGRRTLATWKRQPAFQERVQSLVAEFRELARQQALGTVEGRLKHYNDRHQRLANTIEQRAAAGGDAPGAETGLLVRTFKSVGSGPSAYTVEEWTVDTGLLREMRELEKQVAIEVGDWAEKKEHSGPNGGPIPIQSIEVVFAEREDGPQ